MAQPSTFTVTLELNGKTATGFRVPDDLVERLGSGKRPPVRITINGHTWQSTVAVMGGRFMLGVPAKHRTAAGVSAGDRVKVSLELDSALRTVVVPVDFAEALDAAGLDAAFDRLSPSHKKEHVRAIEEAKKPETRARRIAKSMEMLEQLRTVPPK